MVAQFFGSQLGAETETPLSYTGEPWRLFVSDVRLFFHWILYLPNIILPLGPWPSGYLDELYPSKANLQDMILHCILFLAQAIFLLSLPFLAWVPFAFFISYTGGFFALNYLVCRILNSAIPVDGLHSTKNADSQLWEQHEDEYWIFLNGIAVGNNWLQSNVDRLSRAFHRPVVGVHNKTSGIIFDFIQCIIQRALLFATYDVRQCYVLVKKALYKPGIKKVVLILHSQGAIEGSMILDWLLNEVPQDLLKYLEVYTFGNAANHFNNPYRNEISSAEATAYSEQKTGNVNMIHNQAISHIEHYVNSEDFVARWGVLNFIRNKPTNPLENRFMGRVFVRPGKGHQLNQHYLDTMFPLDPTGRFTRDPWKGDFMDMDVLVAGDTERREGPGLSLRGNEQESSGEAQFSFNVGMLDGEVELLQPVNLPDTGAEGSNKVDGVGRKVRDYSRLWLYRNGGKPGNST